MGLTKMEKRRISRITKEAALKLMQAEIKDVEIIIAAHFFPKVLKNPYVIGWEIRAGGLAIVELFFKGDELSRQNTPGSMSIFPRLECRKILDSFFENKGILEDEIIESWNGLDCIRDGSKCQPSRKPKGFCNEMGCGG